MWNIKKIVSKGDYNYAVVPEHPHATKNGYVLEHRIVMENHLGRVLDAYEVVHHKDGNRKNNMVSNLEVLENEAHARHHNAGKTCKYVKLKCPACGEIFHREARQVLHKGTTFTACSRRCSGVFSRKVQLKGRTVEVEQAISENILEIYHRQKDNPEQTV